jgi:hypothetical protein
MRKHFRRLSPREAVVHRPIQVIWNLCHLASRDKRSHRYQAAIPRCKRRSHKSRNRNFAVFSTTPGDVSPKFACTSISGV